MTTAPEFKGLGLATVLGRAAVINHYVWNSDSPDQPFIAHVHEANPSPRNVLGLLGFERHGEEPIPNHVAPPNLPRNADGNVIGYLFIYQRPALLMLAQWLEGSPEGLLASRDPATTLVGTDLPALTDYRSSAVETLKNLGR